MYHEIIATIISMNIHDLIDDVTRSQNRSNIEIYISPSIFELQRRSKPQNVGNAHGYLSGCSTSGITSGEKSLSGSKSGHFENFEILNTASIWPQMWKYRPKLCHKMFFLWWRRHRWRHRVTSKFLSIFMFRRGWLREQIARAMSRQ